MRPVQCWQQTSKSINDISCVFIISFNLCLLNLRSPQSSNWQSVADRISELERQQNVAPQPTIPTVHYQKATNAAMHHKYTFLDPSKTTRVSNPALKAIQKKAVQSYFERQKSSTTNPVRDHTTFTNRQPMNARPQSLPLTNSNSSSSTKPVNNTTRSSLPSNYAPQHFPPTSSPHHSPTGTSSPTATSNTVVSHSPIQQPSTPIKRSSVHSSPVLTKSFNIVSTSTVTSHALAAPSSYHATFHQSAAAYNNTANAPTVAPNQQNHNQQQQQSSSTTVNTSRNGALSSYHSDHNTEGFPVAGSDHGGKVVQSNADDSMNESGVPPPPPRRNRSMMPVRR